MIKASHTFYFQHKSQWLMLFLVMPGLSSFTATASDLLVTKSSSALSYVEGELLVKPIAHISHSAATQFILASGDEVKKELDSNGLMLIKLAMNETVESAMTRYKATSAYETVQPNFRYYASATANDSSYAQLWGLKNTGQTILNSSYSTHNPGISGNDIDAELAWELQSDCSSVTVAVIDTGINYNHADLSASRWVNSGEIAANGLDDDGNGYIDDVYGYDFIDSDSDPIPADGTYHGTLVAGTIGAKGDNNAGITGVCKSASIMLIRALGISGGTTSSIVSAINYAINNGAKVINLSLGGASYDPGFDAVITKAKTAGVVVVAAAGNESANNNFTNIYPCNYSQDNLVCVAALDQSYSLASSSNYGTTHVDIGAPGTNILSTWPGVQLAEDFSTSWTGISASGTADAWVKSTCTISSTLYDTLVNPQEQCGSPYGPYNNSQDDRAYKSFNLSSYLGARLEYYARIRTTDSSDTFATGIDNAGGDPFDSSAGDSTLASLSGDNGTSWVYKEYSLSNCLTSNCSIGFKFVSDATGSNSEGISIILMKLNTVASGSTTYSVINGTSMAAPHAAGVAALVYAFNPTYTAAEVANSVKFGGESITSLAGLTSTGNALNAYNALRYIQIPTGVTATIQ
jgi:subtilisin family serine protease